MTPPPPPPLILIELELLMDLQVDRSACQLKGDPSFLRELARLQLFRVNSKKDDGFLLHTLPGETVILTQTQEIHIVSATAVMDRHIGVFFALARINMFFFLLLQWITF